MKLIKQAIERYLPRKTLAVLRRIQASVRLLQAERAVAATPTGPRRGHALPGELVLSLTSHAPRFGALAKTLRGLLSQTIAPDKTVLWVSAIDKDRLPPEVVDLCGRGLTIGVSEDMRSYTKIIPTLLSCPDAYIVTADDDLYYQPKWLETLVRGVTPGERTIVCRRALRPLFTPEGAYAPYANWEWDVVTDGGIRDDLFPTGVGGVLYPPGCLAPEVIDRDSFLRLCPTEDDMWLYWMGRRAGSKIRQVGGGFAQVTWHGTQDTSLVSQNMNGVNDGQLRALIAAYPEAACHIKRPPRKQRSLNR